ncbi:cysteine hydrolase family protein [Spirillospora sp. NPDC048824]|uniref:cysteine hydrolase family protein n=1 Tax=Spirillospora sp. NPDC048824 TaxID=3364526 RepID=UPI003717A557
MNEASPCSALLIIDVQEGFLAGSVGVYRGDEFIEVVDSLRCRARNRGMSVMYTQFNGPPGHPAEAGTRGWQIHEKLKPLDGDLVIGKKSTDSFHLSALHDELQRRSITRLYVTGCLTELCVDTTCRRAITLGYEVLLIGDGHTTFDVPVCDVSPAARILLTNDVMYRIGDGSRHICVINASDFP